MYDYDCHLHVGYYLEGMDIEGIALHSTRGGQWHIFFDFDNYRFSVPKRYASRSVEAGFGVKVLEVKSATFAQAEFCKWIEQEILSRIKQEKERA